MGQPLLHTGPLHGFHHTSRRETSAPFIRSQPQLGRQSTLHDGECASPNMGRGSSASNGRRVFHAMITMEVVCGVEVVGVVVDTRPHIPRFYTVVKFSSRTSVDVFLGIRFIEESLQFLHVSLLFTHNVAKLSFKLDPAPLCPPPAPVHHLRQGVRASCLGGRGSRACQKLAVTNLSPIRRR